MLDLNPIKKRLANPPMYRGVVMGNDLIVDIGALVAEVEKIPLDIRQRVNRHIDTWSGQPDCYWFYRLSQEIGELGSSLADDHEHSPEYEMAQIASICINWLIKKEAEAEAEVRRDDRMNTNPEIDNDQLDTD